MSIDTCEFTFPAHLCSAFVNGDTSSLTHDEVADFQAKVAALKADGWHIVDVARDEDGQAHEGRFTWNYRLYGGAADGGDVIDYIAHRITR